MTDGSHTTAGAEAPSAPNMSQRAVLQVLTLEQWKIVAHLPIPVGEVSLRRLRQYAWVETRGEKHETEIRLTQTGLNAMRSVVNDRRENR
jgi:hypothetical protein